MENIINTGTITYALRGRDLLRNKGYKAYMKRNVGKGAVGCGYTIITACPKREIISLFAENGIKYVSIISADE